MQNLEEQKQEFIERLTRNVDIEKSIENFTKRREAQQKEKEKKENLLRTMAKLEGNNQER